MIPLEAFGFVGLAMGTGVAIGLLVRARRDIAETKELIETVNGRSLAILAELSEGRRIRETIPEGERTAREQAYVDALEETEAVGTAHEVVEDEELTARGEPPQGPV